MTSTLEPGTTAEAQGRPEARGRRDFLATRRRTAVVELTMTVLTVAVAVLIAFLVVLASGKDATGALNALLTGPLERTPRIGRWLADATTLALLGLSVSIPFRAGRSASARRARCTSAPWPAPWWRSISTCRRSPPSWCRSPSPPSPGVRWARSRG